MEEITICYKDGSVSTFNGRYVRELETTNWHYYEIEDGSVLHVKKDFIAWVKGNTVKTIKKERSKDFSDWVKGNAVKTTKKERSK